MMERFAPGRFFIVLTAIWVIAGSGQKAHAQALVDSLRHELRIAPEDTHKFHVCHRIAEEFHQQHELDSAIVYADKALEISRAISFGPGIAKAHGMTGYYHVLAGHYYEGISCFKQAMKWSEAHLSPIVHSYGPGNIALTFQELGEYDSALVYMHQCMTIRERIGDSVHLSYTYYDMGELYIELKDYQEAIRYHQKALNMREQIRHIVDEYNVIEDSYSALAMAHFRDGDVGHARFLLEEAFAINLKKGDQKRLGNTHRYFGDIDMQQLEFAAALGRYRKSLDLQRAISDPENQAITLTNMARAYLALFQGDSAIRALNLAANHARSLGSRPQVQTAYEQLALAFAQIGTFDSAYHYSQRASSLKDSLLNEQKVKALREMETKYQTVQKEQEIAGLSAENAEERLANRRKSQLLWVTVGAILLLLLLALFIYRNYREKKRNNALLESQKEEIEAKNELISSSLEEKEALLKEIHHRVKNNLQVISSLLNLQSGSLSDPLAVEAIRQGQNRVKSIALIHQKLYQTEDLARVDFQEYAEQLMGYLSGAFRLTGKRVSVQVEAQGLELDIDTAVPLGLILNEMVTNSYKYAFEDQDIGEIHVRLQSGEEEGRLNMHYWDNGSGLPEGFDLSRAKSLGLKLINILARQLKGSVNYYNQNGAHFEVMLRETNLRKRSA